jgi:hypothetical protein
MLQTQDPVAVVVFAFLVIMLTYFSANNQLLQTSDTAVAFVASVFLWWLRSERRRVTLRRVIPARP